MQLLTVSPFQLKESKRFNYLASANTQNSQLNTRFMAQLGPVHTERLRLRLRCGKHKRKMGV